MLTDFTERTLSVIADAMPPLPKGEALAVPGKVSDFVRSSPFGGAVEQSETERVRMLKSVYFFLFLASSSIRAIWSSGVVQVPTG